MQEFEVTCITKSHPQGGHEYITHIGNTAANWRLTKEAAIAQIEARPQTQAFFTYDRTTGVKAYIGVVRGYGNVAPYLRTYADGEWNDNLLSLAECSASCPVLA